MKIIALFLFLTTLITGISSTSLKVFLSSGNELHGNFVPVPSGFKPNVYIIRTSHGWGSGYYAETEIGNGIVTVGHVIGEDMEIFLYPNSQILIPWESYTCQSESGDSSCFIKVNIDSEPNIVRIPNLNDYSSLEFVVWDKDREVWLPFLQDPYRQCAEGTFCISGQFFNPGTGTEVSQVRQGMSGYTPFLAKNGQPLLQGGKLIALGELTSGASNTSAANVVVVFNSSFKGH